jgi:hypothetical protein
VTIAAVANRIWLESIASSVQIRAEALVTIDFCAAMLRLHCEAGKFEEDAMSALRRLEAMARRILDEGNGP